MNFFSPTFNNYKYRIYTIKCTNFIFSLLFDNKCEICKNPYSQSICPKCLKTDIPVDRGIQEKINQIDTISLFYYENIIRKSLLALKFNNKKSISNDLAILLSENWQKTFFSNKKYEVVPIPASYDKIKRRGYNHVALIAKCFSFINGYKYNDKLLIRTIDTVEQHKLSHKDRITNMEGAFSVNKKYYSNLPLLIIEDIITTGATISKATQALKDSGVTDITVLSIARTKLDKKNNQKKAAKTYSCYKQLDNGQLSQKLENFSKKD